MTNATAADANTMCELLRAAAARGPVGPVTPVLDNARGRRHDAVKGSARGPGIESLLLPRYPPNLNLTERPWRFVRRAAAYGRYHPAPADYRAAIRDALYRVPTTHAETLASLMTLRLQEFEDGSYRIRLMWNPLQR